MADLQRRSPPLSPVLLAGLPLRIMPLGLLRPLMNAAMKAMLKRHPNVFERVSELGDAEFLIDPVDLPISFILRPGGGRPELLPVHDGDYQGEATAKIHGPLMLLIDLMEGRIDGDAVFFSRDLTIEGDTEAVLMLRNAMDSDEIDVADDILSIFGPMRGPAQKVMGVAGSLFDRASDDLEALRSAIIAPVSRRCDRQAAEFQELEEKLANLPAKLRRQNRKVSDSSPEGEGIRQ